MRSSRFAGIVAYPPPIRGATGGILTALMHDEPSRSLSLPEILIISAVALLLVGGTAFVWRTDPARKNVAHGSIPGALARIESAKAQYAADNRLPPETWLTIAALRKSGYLSGQGDFPTDVHFVPGKVGENTTYHFADGQHADHAAPDR